MPLLVCPNCNVGMTQVKRSDVEIDMCPQCRGVWLDRGELEKLLQPLREADERASEPSSRSYQGPVEGHDDHRWKQRDHDHHDDHGHHGYRDEHGRQGRRQGWRGILDAFD